MKKRILGLFLSLLMLSCLVPVSAQETPDAWKTFYVSPDGSDEADGSENTPFKTLMRARDEVRRHNQAMKGDIVINLMPGRYELSSRLELDVEDSGSGGYDVIWRAADPNNMPTISGGEKVSGTWTEGTDGIWHVKADNLEFARELFVNDMPATRAKSTKKIYGTKEYIVGEDTKLGFYVDKSKLGLYENPEDIEFHWSQLWKKSFYHVDDIIQDPENENQVIAIMDRDVWSQFMALNLGNIEAHYARGFVVENAYELLDEPGEFYFNKKTKILSYIPREGENLNSAEVLCPQNDQLLYVRGVNYQNRIHNIRFENICFAHATNKVFEQVSYASGQGEYAYPSEMYARIGRICNMVSWADNIDFESCRFFGLTTSALSFLEGVHNSEVVGCVFSDLGATGFSAGHLEHIENRPPANPDALADVAYQAGWSSSHVHYAGTAYAFLALNTQRASDEDLTSVGRGWYSEPWAKDKGTKPWIKLDLDREYSLENIRLSFPEDATEEQRSNFEILLSNDESFEKYETVKLIETAAESGIEIPVKSDEKYRYIMLRKTISEGFALNGIWAMSADRGPLGQMGAPTDILVANNYFARVAQQQWQTYPIWLNYTKRAQVLHNEIYDAPYSGMSIGWGWDQNNATTSGDNQISYNRIDNVMRHTNDGASIYIFGKQWGTELRGNYMSNADNMNGGMYFDNGCSGVTAIDNVTVNVGLAWFQNSSTRKNAVKGLWTAGDIWKTADATISEVDYTIEDVNSFSYSNPPEQVTRVMAEAGLEEEWEWIKKRVPDAPDVILEGPDAAESGTMKSASGMAATGRLSYDLSIANSMLSMGDYGFLPWQFDPEAKLELEYWVNRVASAQDRTDDYSGGHIEEQYGLKAAIERVNSSSYHPSWEEMLAMCEEIEKNATSDKAWGSYPADKLKTFKKELAAVKASNPLTKADKAVAAGKLEKIYGALDAQCYKAEILSVTVDGGETVIDSENKKVTVYLAAGADAKSIVPEIMTNSAAIVATELSKLDYTKPKLTIPLYNKSLGKYLYWTLETKQALEDAKDGAVSNEAENWVCGNINSVLKKVGDSLTLHPWFEPNMSRQALDGKISFSVMVPRADIKDGIGMIFSAQTSELEATGTESKNTYYMLLLKNQDLSLYRVKGGEKTLCATAHSIDFDYGEFNPFEISIVSEGELDRVTVKLEGDMLIDTLVEEPIGARGYFGIFTQNMTVKIK